jgi:hypothetical protein
VHHLYWTSLISLIWAAYSTAICMHNMHQPRALVPANALTCEHRLGSGGHKLPGCSKVLQLLSQLQVEQGAADVEAPGLGRPRLLVLLVGEQVPADTSKYLTSRSDVCWRMA